MFPFVHRPSPRRPHRDIHGVLALVTLVAMLTAFALPAEPVSIAAADRSAYRSVVESSDANTPSAARNVQVAEGTVQRRAARQPDAVPSEGGGESEAKAEAAFEMEADREAKRAAKEAAGDAPTSNGSDEKGRSAEKKDAADKGKAADKKKGTDKKGADKGKAAAKGKAADKKKGTDKKEPVHKGNAAEKKAALSYPHGSSRLFARHDGMHLFTPSADPVRIGFHEAAFGTAVGMIPLGRALANDNGGKYTLPPLTPTNQQYMVLSSRGRPHHATSAADIVMRPGEPVRSVVTGMVIEAKPYMLYGVYPDAMIRIRSAEDNSKIVTMLHVTGLRVHVGQQVLAGQTIVANSATQFPFLSQIDSYLGGKPRPHVHVEVKRG